MQRNSLYKNTLESAKDICSQGSHWLKKNKSKALIACLLALPGTFAHDTVEDVQQTDHTETVSPVLAHSLASEQTYSIDGYYFAEQLSCYEGMDFSDTWKDVVFTSLVHTIIGSYGCSSSSYEHLGTGGGATSDVYWFQEQILCITPDGYRGPLTTLAYLELMGFEIETNVSNIPKVILEGDEQQQSDSDIVSEESRLGNFQQDGSGESSYEYDTVSYEHDTTNERISDSLSHDEIIDSMQSYLLDTLSIVQVPMENKKYLADTIIQVFETGEAQDVHLSKTNDGSVIHASLSLDTINFMGDSLALEERFDRLYDTIQNHGAGDSFGDNVLVSIHEKCKTDTAGVYTEYPTGRTYPIGLGKLAGYMVLEDVHKEVVVDAKIPFVCDIPHVMLAHEQFLAGILPENSPFVFAYIDGIGWVWMNKHIGVFTDNEKNTYIKENESLVAITQIISPEQKLSSVVLYLTADNRLIIREKPRSFGLSMKKTFEFTTDVPVEPNSNGVYHIGKIYEPGVWIPQKTTENDLYCTLDGRLVSKKGTPVKPHNHAPEDDMLGGFVPQHRVELNTMVGNEGTSLGLGHERTSTGLLSNRAYVSSHTHAQGLRAPGVLDIENIDNQQIDYTIDMHNSLLGLYFLQKDIYASWRMSAHVRMDNEFTFSDASRFAYTPSLSFGGGLYYVSNTFQTYARLGFDPMDTQLMLQGGAQRHPHPSNRSLFTSYSIGGEEAGVQVGAEYHIGKRRVGPLLHSAPSNTLRGGVKIHYTIE